MRADRLLSLMLLLQARGRMTAQDLAETLEVSERTIYRDIDALSVAGVPVYTQPGTNGGVFLDENYRISLTGLSKPEVLSLFASSGPGPLKDIGLDKAVEDTLLKLFAALPSMHRGEVEHMRQRLYIDPSHWFEVVEPLPFLSLLQQAVWEDRVIEVSYRRAEGELFAGQIEPYALIAKANVWYLVGRKMTGDMRTYRAGRFEKVQLTGEIFDRPPEFDLLAYWEESTQSFQQKMTQDFPPYPATLSIKATHLWYFETFLFGRYHQLTEPDENGWVTIRVNFFSVDDARGRVLGVGQHIRVIEPAELRQDVMAVSRAVLRLYDE